MIVHSLALCSVVTVHGTFVTQSGNFPTRPCVSQNTKWQIQCIAGISHSAMNWQSSVSCADTAERNRIALAIFDFHQRTPVRFRLYDPQTDRDYVYITGQNTGCWSYVGRIGGVSNRVQGVVKTSPALRTVPFGFCSITPHKTKPIWFLSNSKALPRVWGNQNRLIRFGVNHSGTSCEFIKDQSRETNSWPGYKLLEIICLFIMGLCNNMFLLHRRLYRGYSGYGIRIYLRICWSKDMPYILLQHFDVPL